MRRLMIAMAAASALVWAAPASAAKAPIRPVPHGFMGVVVTNDLLSPPSLVPSEFRVMKRSGVQSVKAEFTWSSIEPHKGVYDWSKPDALVRAAARQRFSVLPTVLDAPAWAYAGPTDEPIVHHPDDPEDFARFLTTLIHRYGPKGSFWAAHPNLPRVPIRAWEVWNEPDLFHWWKPPWVRPYIALLRAAHHAIKATDPHAKVVLAGLTYVAWRDMAQLYKNGARRLFDVVSVHPYTKNPSNVLVSVARTRKVMNAHGDAGKPMWVTELSWTSGEGRATKGEPLFLNSTPQGQAKLLRRAYLGLARTRKQYNVRRVYWFSWMSGDRSDDNPFDWSGLRRLRDGSGRSKPALKAYAAVARELEGKR